MKPDRVAAVARPAARRSRPAVGWRSTFASLSEGDFLRLWLGLQVMSLATQMQMLARTFLAYELTGSAVVIALVSASMAIPMLTFGLLGGAIADRLDRKVLIQAGQLGLAGVAVLVGISITTDTVTWGHLLVAGALQGGCWATLNPARQAMIPQLVPRDKLTNAMALASAGKSLTTVLAPAIGGLLYAAVGPEGVYYLVSAMLVIAVVLTATIKSVTTRTRSAQTQVLADVKSGLSYIANSRMLLVILAVGMTTILFANPFLYLLPVFVVDVYGRDSDAFGLLISMLGVGALLGSLVVAALGSWRRGALLIAGGLFSGTALLLVGAVPVYYAALFFMFLLGVGSVAHLTLSQTLMMEQVDDELRGRVTSVFGMSTALMPFALIPIGIAVDAFGGQAVALTMGVALLAVSSTAFATQRQLRRLD